MEFKYCSIDPYNSTREEIKEEIERLKHEMNDASNTQIAFKLFINSAYGAIGNQYFQCYNTDIAEAVTLQGQDIIKHINTYIEKYFKEKWHLDKKLHEKLGIEVIHEVAEKVTVYGDTDSLYVSFEPVFNTIKDFTITKSSDHIDMIKNIYKYRLQDYFKNVQKLYAAKFNTEDLQVFEMEKIAKFGIFLAKKKYVLNVSWEDSGANGIYFDHDHIVSKGIETVQSSTPKFAREVVEDILGIIFDKGKKVTLSTIIKRLKEHKKRFKVENIENISFLSGINDYNKYVVSDRNRIEVRDRCPIHVRASAIHNFMLNNNTGQKTKYSLIKNGDKVRYYYVKDADDSSNVFGFRPGEYPAEFAPEMDYDIMFSKTIIDPINRFVVVLGLPEVPDNLIHTNSLF